MRGLLKKGIDAYLNYKSFKTDHPIVIIESDDWGSLRTRDTATRFKLNSIQPAVQKDPYTQLDSIATQEDLEALFEVLGSVQDAYGNPACITANVCTANPDFEAIKADGFQRFHYKPFTTTLEEYSTGKSLWETWKQGIQEKVLAPQLHGREHVHALAWLAELRAGNKELVKAFDYETWGIPYQAKWIQRRKNLQASLDNYQINGEENYHKKWIEDGVQIFYNTFGYYSKTFIAPAYVWHNKHNIFFKENNIISLQGIKLQYQPNHNHTTNYKRIPHYIGQTDNSTGIIYTTRNAFFEPYSSDSKLINSSDQFIKSTLQEVELAIRHKKPVIIGSHRINYVGRLDTAHRDHNLRILKKILQQIVSSYPTVEFMDGGKLAEKISNKKNNEK